MGVFLKDSGKGEEVGGIVSLLSKEKAFWNSEYHNQKNIGKMKTIITIGLCCLLHNATAQSEIRYFHLVAAGSKEECASVRFYELKKMIYKKDFRFLKYIYPKVGDITLKKMTMLSNVIGGYNEENFGYSGAATIEGCKDCGTLLISELYYEQNGLNIDHLFSINIEIEKQLPFFLIGNKKIKALDILLTKNAGNFLIPDAILSMDNLKVLSFRGEGVVVLPKVLFDPVKRASTKIKLMQKPGSEILFIPVGE